MLMQVSEPTSRCCCGDPQPKACLLSPPPDGTALRKALAEGSLTDLLLGNHKKLTFFKKLNNVILLFSRNFTTKRLAKWKKIMSGLSKSSRKLK